MRFYLTFEGAYLAMIAIPVAGYWTKALLGRLGRKLIDCIPPAVQSQPKSTGTASVQGTNLKCWCPAIEKSEQIQSYFLFSAK